MKPIDFRVRSDRDFLGSVPGKDKARHIQTLLEIYPIWPGLKHSSAIVILIKATSLTSL